MRIPLIDFTSKVAIVVSTNVQKLLMVISPNVIVIFILVCATWLCKEISYLLTLGAPRVVVLSKIGWDETKCLVRASCVKVQCHYASRAKLLYK